MKHAVLAVIFGAVSLLAQNPGGSVLYVAVDPSGACGFPQADRQNFITGTLWVCKNGTWATVAGSGSGTVTNTTFTGGLISIASPTTTPAFTVAGTTGGIPYFSSASTWASSTTLTQHGVVIGGGAGASPTSTAAGTTGNVLTSNGSGADPTFQAVAVAFNNLSGGTNGGGNAFVIGSTSSLGVSGSGTISATSIGNDVTDTVPGALVTVSVPMIASASILGGTAANSNLAFTSTSGTGTTDYIKFSVGTNGGTEAMRILHSGAVTIQSAGSFDASGSAHTLPMKVVASVGALPGTCTAGEQAIVTAATLGQQIYECSTGNVWTQQTGGSGSFSVSVNGGSSSPGITTLDMVAGSGFLNALNVVGATSHITQTPDTSILQTRTSLQTNVSLFVTETSSSTSTYTGTMNPTLTNGNLVAGSVFYWQVLHACAGGATTWRIDGTGSGGVSVYRADGITNPLAGDCPLNAIVPLEFDGSSHYRIMNAVAGSGGTGSSAVSLSFNTSGGTCTTTPSTGGVACTATSTTGVKSDGTTAAPGISITHNLNQAPLFLVCEDNAATPIELGSNTTSYALGNISFTSNNAMLVSLISDTIGKCVVTTGSSASSTIVITFDSGAGTCTGATCTATNTTGVLSDGSTPTGGISLTHNFNQAPIFTSCQDNSGNPIELGSNTINKAIGNISYTSVNAELISFISTNTAGKCAVHP